MRVKLPEEIVPKMQKAKKKRLRESPADPETKATTANLKNGKKTATAVFPLPNFLPISNF